jgi:hypothetical protein
MENNMVNNMVNNMENNMENNMVNKRFNYIEFKISLINNEVNYLENYIISNSNKLDEKDVLIIRAKLSKLTDVLDDLEKTYLSINDKKVKDLENPVFFKPHNDILNFKDACSNDLNYIKQIDEMAYKVSQINYII